MKFYITTPIYYINGKPHIGHAYATIVADVLARFRKEQGEDVIFSVGVDENSQKTLDAADKAGEEVHAYTDRMADLWESTWEKLRIANTDFVRTTDPQHIEVVNDFWARMEAAGDLYKGKYEGLYCTGHEAFMNEDELTPDGLCPEHKITPEFVSEENYYFRLSNYQQKLLDFYEANPDFIAPANRFNEMKSFVERGLEDTSFSRENREWGIQVPNDPHQRIYVWADALVSYVSLVGIERWEEHPADIHTVGKDILRFHSILWPAMLMSAGLPLPGQILASGLLTIDGTKMGKSLGNVIDPLDLTARYGIDALRYFLLREVPFGEDGDFSEEKMKERYNGDLANGLGNFAARILTLAEKEGPFDEKSVGPNPEIDARIKEARKIVSAAINVYRFGDALATIWKLIQYGDGYVNANKIWEDVQDPLTRKLHIFNMIHVLQNIGELLRPFMPETSANILHAIIEKDKIVLFPRIN